MWGQQAFNLNAPSNESLHAHTALHIGSMASPGDLFSINIINIKAMTNALLSGFHLHLLLHWRTPQTVSPGEPDLHMARLVKNPLFFYTRLSLKSVRSTATLGFCFNIRDNKSISKWLSHWREFQSLTVPVSLSLCLVSISPELHSDMDGTFFDSKTISWCQCIVYLAMVHLCYICSLESTWKQVWEWLKCSLYGLNTQN